MINNRNVIWRIVLGILACLYIFHALYFDWSDRYGHLFIAFVFIIAGLWWPENASKILIGLFSVILLFHIFWHPPQWTESVVVGSSWSKVQEKLGTPDLQTESLDEAKQSASGWSHPSPLRFRHSGPVSIYFRADSALWIMHDGERVVHRYVGGS